MRILEGLNDAQRRAVETTEGPLLILAGPGSGKTRVITHRIAHLIEDYGVNPRSILAVTFTNKAAREMKDRVNDLVGNLGREVNMGTFHSSCVRILRQEIHHLGRDNQFVIYDDGDQQSLIKRALADMGLDEKYFKPAAIQSRISAAKSELVSAFSNSRYTNSYFEEVAYRVYRRYQEMLIASNALDFDDLLMVTLQLFREHPQVLKAYQAYYHYVLVDEFQDTNLAQYELVKQLAAAYKNICVVGDPDQSIYSWRSADIRNILNFETDYPDARTIVLERNYRSSQIILDVADGVISANKQRKQKKLWTDRQQGARAVVHEAYDEQEEARFVAREVERLQTDGLCSPGDCAVMYRTNVQSRAVEDIFVRYGIPYKLIGGTRFYERKEVKDVLAYLRLIHNPYDSVSLHRIINVPGRGIGKRTLDDLSQLASELAESGFTTIELLDRFKKGEIPPEFGAGLLLAKAGFGSKAEKSLLFFYSIIRQLIQYKEEHSVVNLLDKVLELTGYRDFLLDGSPEGELRWENIQELRTKAQEYNDLSPRSGLATFLEETALVSDVDSLEEGSEAITLITLHAAKGLEFSTVFIIGLEEGILPHSRSIDDPASIEEERRLCYVGITRAKERLYLIRATRRALFGNYSNNPASRFLKDVPQQLVTGNGAKRTDTKRTDRFESRPRESSDRIVNVQRTQPAPVASPQPLEPGQLVRHAKFGEGFVISCVPSVGDFQISVQFKGEAGLKKLLLGLANLEKV